jgi:hypothetical protein
MRPGVAQRTTLTEKQVSILHWIADGRPDRIMDGDSHRISAAALRNRGLVTTSGRGPTWWAEITQAGREYLARVNGPKPPVPRQANASVTQQLVDNVLAAGGLLRVPRKDPYDCDGVDHEHRARLAERYGKVPAGKSGCSAWIAGVASLIVDHMSGNVHSHGAGEAPHPSLPI